MITFTLLLSSINQVRKIGVSYTLDEHSGAHTQGTGPCT